MGQIGLREKWLPVDHKGLLLPDIFEAEGTERVEGVCRRVRCWSEVLL